MTRLRAALAATAVLLLAACDVLEPSENVNQDRIWTEYELRYDGNEDVTTATASFRFGGSTGTPLELSEPSFVTVNGDELVMRVEPLTNVARYERDFAGLMPTATFEWVDTEGRPYVNDIALRSIAAPPTVGPIDNDASYELRWSGASLAAGEEVRAKLYRVFGGAAFATFTQRSAGATSVILDRAQLQYIQPGEVTLVLERHTTRPLTERTEVGGRITGVYGAAPVGVEIVE